VCKCDDGWVGPACEQPKIAFVGSKRYSDWMSVAQANKNLKTPPGDCTAADVVTKCDICVDALDFASQDTPWNTNHEMIAMPGHMCSDFGFVYKVTLSAAQTPDFGSAAPFFKGDRAVPQITGTVRARTSNPSELAQGVIDVKSTLLPYGETIGQTPFAWAGQYCYQTPRGPTHACYSAPIGDPFISAVL